MIKTVSISFTNLHDAKLLAMSRERLSRELLSISGQFKRASSDVESNTREQMLAAIITIDRSSEFSEKFKNEIRIKVIEALGFY